MRADASTRRGRVPQALFGYRQSASHSPFTAAPLIPPSHARLRGPRSPWRHVVPESIEAGRLWRTSRAPHGIDVVPALAIDAPAPLPSTAEQLLLACGVLDDHEFAGTAAGTAARHRVQVLFTPAGVE